MKRFWIVAGIVLIGASRLQAAVTSIIEIVNTLSISRPDALVVWTRSELEKRVGDIGRGKYVQMSGVSGQPVLIQFDDLNGDGEWDEAVMVHTFAAHEKLQLSVRVSDAPAAIKAVVRAHVRMKEKGADNTFGPDLDSVVMPLHNPPTDFSKEKLPRWLTEGPGWENDKVAYRLYFDTRNGKDIYGKRLPGMVMDWVGADTAKSYHELADWGMDVLKVGSSLGAGALALSIPIEGKRDTLIRLGGLAVRREAYRKIADGPLRAIFRMEYEWDVIGHDVTIVEEISITAGQYYYQSKVTVSGAPAGSRLVTGIANFYTNEPGNFKKDAAMVLYSHGMQSENKDMMGMAIMVGKSDFSSFRSLPASGGEINSTYCVSQTIGDGALYFRFYTGWEKTDGQFSTPGGFKKMLEEESVRFSHALREKIKAGASRPGSTGRVASVKR